MRALLGVQKVLIIKSLESVLQKFFNFPDGAMNELFRADTDVFDENRDEILRALPEVVELILAILRTVGLTSLEGHPKQAVLSWNTGYPAYIRSSKVTVAAQITGDENVLLRNASCKVVELKKKCGGRSSAHTQFCASYHKDMRPCMKSEYKHFDAMHHIQLLDFSTKQHPHSAKDI
mmetsp:Transcript_14218/g.21861  ORF Transcript_14218/g.21861 Transcript_14218/m.21861 type:complete len:177 (+) Transcript_14218:1986-2516(+)